MPPEQLSARALNRATLARQLLLERSDMAPRDAVAHLVGMQAQMPLDPYVGLWSRLRGFRPEALGRLLTDRELVRIVVMRGTIHLLTAEDVAELRPPVQPILDRELAFHGEHKEALRDIDPAPILEVGAPLPVRAPADDPGDPRRDGGALPGAPARRPRVPVPQPPGPRAGAAARGLGADAAGDAGRRPSPGSGAPLAERPDLERIARRYLGAFGPATPADLAAWSGLPSMRAVLEGLRPELRAFRDERGRELLDLPDAPRPDPETPAPPRFLPEYDNVLLAHADRTRFISEEDRRRLGAAPGPAKGSVLLDGTALGTWWIERSEGAATLTVRHLRPLAARARDRLSAEGRRLLRLTDPSAGPREIRLVPVPHEGSGRGGRRR